MFEPDAEGMLPERRQQLQLQRLRGLVDRLLAAEGVTAARLRAAGVSAAADVVLGDLPRLPMTVKADIIETYPFGMICVDPSDLVAVHGSSGTGGRPALVAYTRGDLSMWARMCARALAAAGAGTGSIVHNAYGYGLFTGGIGIHQGAVELGATVVPASGGMTRRQVALIRDLRPDILTCTPSYAVRLGEALAEAGVRPGDGLALRAGLFGAEPWSGQLRRRIEELLGLRALDIYGLSEVIGPGVASECLAGNGWLHVNEDHFLVEAVDPASGQPVPDGERGELVFSTVTRQALPLLRYASGDIAALRHGTCECGRTLVQMSQVAGRRDDMLVLRGVNVYPSEVERVLLSEPALSPDYLLVVDERNDRPELIACCEYRAAGAGQPSEGELEHQLREELGVGVRVRVLPQGTVPRSETGKAVRVRRWRDGGPPLQGLV